MSRRKQAKPRALVLKHDEMEQELADSLETGSSSNVEGKDSQESFLQEHPLDDNSPEGSPSNSDTLGTEPSLSWDSETGDEDQISLSPSSCATPNSLATEANEQEVNFTIGPTETTPYCCQFCNKAFPRLSYLKKHEQSHSDQMPFKCDFCQRLFKHKRSRDRHVKLHTGDKKYRCPHCESAFSRSDHLKIHMKTHDHQKPFQCVICNRGYNTAAALTSHMQNHKKESVDSSPSPGPFRCLQCTGTFATGEELQAHVSHHHRPISSSSPDKGDHSTSSSINKRRSISPKTPSSPSTRARTADLDHASPRLMLPFPIPKLACIYCTKDSFTTMEALQLHVQAMHGPLLNGDLAEMSNHLSPLDTTSGMSSAADHLASLGPFTCTFCTMKFSSLGALQKHAMTVHSLSGYLQAKAKENSFCAQCSMAFPNSIAYVEHFLLYHANPGRTRKLMQVCSPEPPQVKPTDLSKKAKGDSGSSLSSTSSSGVPAAKKCKKEEDNESCGRASVVGSPGIVSSGLMSGSAGLFGPHSLLCNQCNAGFRDFESFRTHLKSHLEDAGHKFVCEECESEFLTEDQLENHAMAHYLTTTTEYGCQSCLKLFGKPDELQKHLMDIHAHHLYRCSLCKEMFDSKVSIQVHFAVKHSNECKLFRCIRCNSCTTVFRSEFEFQVHVKMAHLRKLSPYRCLLCSSSFISELDLQYHLSTHQKQFRCKLCDDAFHVEFLLDKHMQTHHSVMVNGEADSTSSSTTAAAAAAATITSSSGGGKGSKKGNSGSGSAKTKDPKCDICDKSMGSEAELTSHRKQVHHIAVGHNTSATHAGSLNNTERSYGCGSNNNGPKSGQKSNHLLNTSSGGNGTSSSIIPNPNGTSSTPNHHQTLSLLCAYCNENCKSRSDLENHMKTHQVVATGKHKCNICDEVCPTATLLAEHKLTHCKVISGNICATCKVSITSEESFYFHMKQHSGGSCALANATANNSNGSDHSSNNNSSTTPPGGTKDSNSSGTSNSNNNNNNNNSNNNNNCSPTSGAGGAGGGNSSNATQTAGLPTNCIVCRQTLMTDIEVQLHARFHTRQAGSSDMKSLISPNSAATLGQRLAAAAGTSGLTGVGALSMIPSILNNNTLACLSSTAGFGLTSATCSTASSLVSQCVVCLKTTTDEKTSPFPFLNGLTNGVQNYVCQTCYSKSSISLLTSQSTGSPRKNVKSLESPSEEESYHQIDTANININNKSRIIPSSATSPNFAPICLVSTGGSNGTSSGRSSIASNASSSATFPNHNLSNSANNNNNNNNHNGNPTTPPRSYQCIKCQMSFGSEDEVQAHVATHLMNEGSNHECHLCSHVFFDSPLKLQTHLIEHTFEGCSAFTCYMCSSSWTSAKKLQEHMVEHGLHSRPYDCNQCHLKFFFRAELENHIFTHEDIKKAIIETISPSSAAASPFSSNPSLGLIDSNARNESPTISNNSLSQEAINYHQALIAAHKVTASHLYRSHSTSPGSPPLYKKKTSINKSHRKPKKFFYRSDDSDEEMESITIKKEVQDPDEDSDTGIINHCSSDANKRPDSHLSSEESTDATSTTPTNTAIIKAKSPSSPSPTPLTRTPLELDKFEGRESLSVT